MGSDGVGCRLNDALSRTVSNRALFPRCLPLLHGRLKGDAGTASLSTRRASFETHRTEPARFFKGALEGRRQHETGPNIRTRRCGKASMWQNKRADGNLMRGTLANNGS